MAVTVSSTDMWILVAIGVLLALAVVLAAAETALTRVTRTRAEALAAERRRGGAALVELVDRPEQFVTTVVFLLLVCQIVQATLVGIVADRLFGVVGMVVAIAIDVVVVFVLADSAPKTWAVLNPERVALAVARPVRTLARFPPLRLAARGLIGLTNVVLPGKGLKQGPFVSSDEELLAVAELGVEEGVIEEDERALIESILEFGDTVVREVMVPRTDVVFIEGHKTLRQFQSLALRSGFSRIPVIGPAGLDDVVGIAYLKDIARRLYDNRDAESVERVDSVLRPALYVPDSKPVDDLLREMQAQRTHVAVVVDEYGGTAGLVTIEDLLEEIVGEFTTDPATMMHRDVHAEEDGTFVVNASASVRALNR
ncbi:MAG: hemolysin family protein, partial [Acidimicrobiales bacterium]